MNTRRGDGVSARRRKRRRHLAEPEHIADRAELDAWLTEHSTTTPTRTTDLPEETRCTAPFTP